MVSGATRIHSTGNTGEFQELHFRQLLGAVGYFKGRDAFGNFGRKPLMQNFRLSQKIYRHLVAQTFSLSCFLLTALWSK